MRSISDKQTINLKESDKKYIQEEQNDRDAQDNDYNLESRDIEASDDFIEWQAEEYSYFPKTKKWFIGLAFFAGLVEFYFFWTQNFFSFATFLFIFFVVFLYSIKKPRVLRFKIDYQGIKVGGRLYKFDSFQSFWIFYDPPQRKEIFLKGKKSFAKFLGIPIGSNDPVVLRKILKKYLPEIEEEESLIDILVRKIGF